MQLGYANPDAMLREMSCGQLYEWIAFQQSEPWGTPALDLILAHFKALFVNSNLKKGKRPYKTNKFLLFGREKKNSAEAEWDDDEQGTSEDA